LQCIFSRWNSHRKKRNRKKRKIAGRNLKNKEEKDEDLNGSIKLEITYTPQKILIFS
jgi:hypothetical protein